jgi:flagellar hook-basal body complex protein FliE
MEQISAISRVDSSASMQQMEQINPMPQQAGITFGQIMTEGVNGVNESLKIVNVQLEKLALNEPVSTHDLMITMEKAKLELQMAIEVRNKVVEAYQELMRMQL